jgi:hypothetical protein
MVLFEKHTGVKAPTMALPYTPLHYTVSMIYRLSGRTNTTLEAVRAEMGCVFWVRECRHDFLSRCSASMLLRAMPPNLLPALAQGRRFIGGQDRNLASSHETTKRQ